jgi:adenylate cyclase class IV
MHNYEIEIKVLLGDEVAKNKFIQAIEVNFPAFSHSYRESQKNHYFEWGNLLHLLWVFREYISQEEAVSLHELTQKAKSFSVRTRGTKDETILVVKATVNDETSSNGTARIEWEVDLFPMALETMDEKVLSAGFTYQAKWSRERDEYRLDHDTALCIDKNAWYGYIAEFERVITDESHITDTRHELIRMIRELWYDELDQDRLTRMFDHYNKNWSEYYGTEKVFTVL